MGKYCTSCGKWVQSKEKYGWQVAVFGFSAWIIAGVVFKLGSWSFAIAMLVGGISSGIFRYQHCPECNHRIEEKPLQEKQDDIVETHHEIVKQPISESEKPRGLFASFAKGYKEGKERNRQKREKEKSNSEQA